MKKYVLTLLAGTVFCSMTALATPTEEVKNVGAQETIKIEAPLHKKARASKGRENFVKRLQLSEEQQKKADEIHQKSKGEMKEIHSQMKQLRQKADAIREQNKKEFEALLTPEQKEILKTIAQEHKNKQHRKKWMNGAKPIENK